MAAVKTKKQRNHVQHECSRLINRELSWLKFNGRVLEEAFNPANPLLERLKFLSIFESNLDEFYMVRVSGLIEQFESGLGESSPDGLSPSEQLRQIMKATRPLRKEAARCFNDFLKPALLKAGIAIKPLEKLTTKQVSELDELFESEIFPVCTPLVLHPASSPPFISNRSLNLVVELGDPDQDFKLARVKLPSVLPRLVRLNSKRSEFVLLEEIIQRNLKKLFPGVRVRGSYLFRVIRDADIEIRELEAADLITTIEETIKRRRFGDPVLLEAERGMPERIQRVLVDALEVDSQRVLHLEKPIGYDMFWELVALDRPDLKFPNHTPFLAESISTSKGLFETVQSHDVLLHHPYDSFRCVEEFVESAAEDPDVVGIKQTLYRVGSESPIVESLLDAAEEGKQVAAIVELKARFDESNNLGWARALERAGAHVSYGFLETKTHCKLSLLVRREQPGLRQYAHIGTGNYNPATARMYTDIGLITDDSQLTQDIAELFNYLTGFSRQNSFRKLLVAPANLRERMLDLIHSEKRLAEKNGKARIILKLNALVDPEAIEALYEASCAGVQIDLIVRGICCLKPGVAGMSDNIRVVSIVGRFLEHSRIYYFEGEGSPTVLIGSADLMRRNLDRRVEVLAPVESPFHVEQLKQLLEVCLKDTVQAWDLDSEGKYIRRKAPDGKAFSSQVEFMKMPMTRKIAEWTASSDPQKSIIT